MRMPKDINCINFKGLLAYLESSYGKAGVETVMEGLVDNPQFLVQDKYDPSIVSPIGSEQVIDSAYWVSNEFSMALLGAVKKVVEGENPRGETSRLGAYIRKPYSLRTIAEAVHDALNR